MKKLLKRLLGLAMMFAMLAPSCQPDDKKAPKKLDPIYPPTI